MCNVCITTKGIQEEIAATKRRHKIVQAEEMYTIENTRTRKNGPINSVKAVKFQSTQSDTHSKFKTQFFSYLQTQFFSYLFVVKHILTKLNYRHVFQSQNIFIYLFQ